MSVPFIEEHLRALRLPTMLQNYKRLAQGDDNRITYLGELSSLEVNKRHENGVRSRIAAAKFPVIKTALREFVWASKRITQPCHRLHGS
jgi:hypothetical protein